MCANLFPLALTKLANCQTICFQEDYYVVQEDKVFFPAILNMKNKEKVKLSGQIDPGCKSAEENGVTLRRYISQNDQLSFMTCMCICFCLFCLAFL